MQRFVSRACCCRQRCYSGWARPAQLGKVVPLHHCSYPAAQCHNNKTPADCSKLERPGGTPGNAGQLRWDCRGYIQALATCHGPYIRLGAGRLLRQTIYRPTWFSHDCRGRPVTGQHDSRQPPHAAKPSVRTGPTRAMLSTCPKPHALLGMRPNTTGIGPAQCHDQHCCSTRR